MSHHLCFSGIRRCAILALVKSKTLYKPVFGWIHFCFVVPFLTQFVFRPTSWLVCSFPSLNQLTCCSFQHFSHLWSMPSSHSKYSPFAQGMDNGSFKCSWSVARMRWWVALNLVSVNDTSHRLKLGLCSSMKGCSTLSVPFLINIADLCRSLEK